MEIVDFDGFKICDNSGKGIFCSVGQLCLNNWEGLNNGIILFDNIFVGMLIVF